MYLSRENPLGVYAKFRNVTVGDFEIADFRNWEAYKMKCETSFLTRNGTLACKVTQPLELDNIYKKPEFVAEHEGRAAFLFALLMLTGGSNIKLSSDMASKSRQRDAFYYMLFLLCHDVGEIVGGDALDDGSDGHEDARATEARVMGEFLSLFPSEARQRLQKWQSDFENYRGDDGTKFIKAIDKAEAVAFQLFLQTKGVFGDVELKEPPSKRDLKMAELIGTSRSTDVWCLHFRIVTKHFAPEILKPIYGFLAAGFYDAYQSEDLPKCMTIDVSDLELD